MGQLFQTKSYSPQLRVTSYTRALVKSREGYRFGSGVVVLLAAHPKRSRDVFILRNTQNLRIGNGDLNLIYFVTSLGGTELHRENYTLDLILFSVAQITGSS